MPHLRISCLLLTASLALAAIAPATGQGERPSKSALESDPTGWIDILPGKDLKGWKRVVLAPDEKLSSKNPWAVDDQTKTLICDGVGVKEMFLYDREFADGIFHVEWRFRPVDGQPEYNSGIYVRSADDGKTWHQAQVAHVKKPPFMGDLFGDTLVDGQAKRVVIQGDGHKRVNPPGKWNTYEITCKGKVVTVWINGTVATTWNDCPLPKGHVGMQAEFFYLEFRNLKFKELK